jgi:hypothetical protein
VFCLVGGGGTGVGQEAGDGLGGGVGDGGADGDPLVLLAVDGLDVEVLEEPFGQPGVGLGEDVTQDRQRIQQGRVADLGGRGVKAVSFGFQRFLLGMEFAVPGPDPLAQGQGSRVTGVGGGLQLGDEGLLGGLDLRELLVQALGLGGAARGFLGGVGGGPGTGAGNRSTAGAGRSR